MDTMLADLPFATAYLDDIIIVSQNESDHGAHLSRVLNKISEYGFRVKPEKCSFFMSRIQYLGIIIDCNGRRPDPDKVRAIRDMPRPTNVSTLQSFLGMINYYSQFIPDMHKLRAPFNHLLSKNVRWHWSAECEESFTKFRDILMSGLSLTHYDPKQDIIVAADASEYGIGAVLLHRFPDGSTKAVSHMSRSLTPTEKNYSQIEKEGLALVFAVHKFHKMIHGRKFLLQTDHKPLVAIFGAKKGIPVHTANRLQRWATTLLGYDFTLEYIPSSKLGHADSLSRLIATHSIPDEDIVISSVAVDTEVERVLSDAIRRNTSDG